MGIEITTKTWWDKYSNEHRPYPHLICHNLRDGRYKCRHCGIEGEYNKINKTSCTERPKPCKWCGQTPLCAPDCVGIRMILSDPKVYVTGSNPFEEKPG